MADEIKLMAREIKLLSSRSGIGSRINEKGAALPPPLSFVFGIV
jgi:hypothetical protein